MTANKIQNIARDLDAKRFQKYLTDNRAIWNLEYEAEKAIKLCSQIHIEWTPGKNKIRFFSE